MTNRIDQLAKAGLVRREPDPQDKRGVLVVLTPVGTARVDAALADLLGSEEKLLAGLDPGQREDLSGLLRTLLAPFDARERPGSAGDLGGVDDDRTLDRAGDANR